MEAGASLLHKTTSIRVPVGLSAVALIASLLVGGANTAFAVSPQEPTGSQVAAPTARGEARLPLQQVQWKKCPRKADKKLRCATLSVPQNWNRFDGKRYRLVMKMLSSPKNARSSAKKKYLFMNPGGPGGSASDILDLHGDFKALRRSFHLVSWDPRGVGDSQPKLAKCVGSQFLGYPSTGPFTWLQIASLQYQGSAQSNEACTRANRGLGPNINTNQVIQDLEFMRRSMRVGKLNYVGHSYGTTIGRLYAMKYPSKIRAMVLDGVVMPYNTMNSYRESASHGSIASWRMTWGSLSSAVQAVSRNVENYLQNRTITIEGSSVSRWKFWDEGFDTGATSKPAEKYTSYVCQLAEAASLSTVGCPVKTRAESFAELVRRIEAAQPKRSPIAQLVRCSDYRDRPTAHSTLADFTNIAKSVPQTNENYFGRALMCSGAPNPVDPIPPMTKKVRLKTAPLFINSTGDAATSYWGAKRSKNMFTGSRMITVKASQHAVFQSGAVNCIKRPAVAYLKTARLPKKNLTCGRAY